MWFCAAIAGVLYDLRCQAASLYEPGAYASGPAHRSLTLPVRLSLQWHTLEMLWDGYTTKELELILDFIGRSYAMM
jgi:hypothetical protein